MARCPFAIWKPISENATQGHITPRAVILHTAVSNADSLFDFFQNGSVLESHFYVRDDGTIEQYLDTTVRADANLNANDFAVSIETWDGGIIRPWTTAQVNALVRLVIWLCNTHSIPKVQIPKWDGRGIGWHVMFGAPGPWTPISKSCPGSPRILQTKSVIIPRVAAGDDEVTEAEMEEIANRVTAKILRYKNTDVVGANGPDVYGLMTTTYANAAEAEFGSDVDVVSQGHLFATEKDVNALETKVASMDSKLDTILAKLPA